MKEMEKEIKSNLRYFTGKFMQKYPLYSSKTVEGKQLFEYARAGAKVEAPEREIRVEELKFLKLRKISGRVLFADIERRIKKVKGDFRQKEILKIWRKKLKARRKEFYFFVANFRIKCGSGTYVRGIAHSLGERLGVPALALSIKRTKIGKWSKISP